MLAKNDEKIQSLGHFFGCTLGEKLGFYVFWSKNKNKSKFSWNTTELCRSSVCIFIEGSAKKKVQNSIYRSLFWCLEF